MAPISKPHPGDPDRLDGYWLAGRLGAGGQGVVYEAYDDEGRRVAIKVLHGDVVDDEEIREQIAREAGAARRVSSFCTARVLEVRLDRPRPYIVSEYVEGPSLARAVREGRVFAGDDLHRLAIAVAVALTAIHAAGVIHRDLKPDNVLLGPDGPRVIDFGVARTEEMPATTTGKVRGTLGYIAPEVLTGQRAGPAADVFALGGIILFAATGRDPFEADSLGGVMQRVLSADPDLDALPASLRALVGGALRKDPRARPTAGDLLMTLLGDLPETESEAMALAGARAGLLGREEDRDPGLGARAEQVFATLDRVARAAVPRVMLRLITVGEQGEESPQRVRGDELAGGVAEEDRAAVGRVVAAFEQAGLLAADDDVVRLARPALVRAWPRLRSWVDGHREGLRLRAEVTSAAVRWHGQGRRDGDLFQGTRLRAALGIEASPLVLTPSERAFLDAGVALERRRAWLRRLLTGALVVLLVLALAGGGLALRQTALVTEQRDQAQALQMSGKAGPARAADPVTAMLLGVAAWRVAPSPQTRAVLTGALVQPETAAFRDPATTADVVRDLSPDGRTLVSVGAGAAHAWDVRTGRVTGEIADLGISGQAVRTVAAGSHSLAVGTDDGVYVWDLRSGRMVARTHDVGPGIYHLWLTFGAGDRYLRIDVGGATTLWNLSTGRKTKGQIGGDVVSGGAFDPSGRWWVGGFDLKGILWFRLPGVTPERGAGGCRNCHIALGFDPGGDHLAAGYSGRLHVIDMRTRKVVHWQDTMMEDAAGRGWNDGPPVYSADGRMIATLGERTVQLWRASDLVLLRTLSVPPETWTVAFDPDGRTLRYLSDDKVISLDVADVARAARLTIGPEDDGETKVALSPDGRLVALRPYGRGGDARWIRVSDVPGHRAHGRPLDALTARGIGRFTMRFSPDGRLLATNWGSPPDPDRLADGVAKIWDTSGCCPPTVIDTGSDAEVTDFAFSPDGARLAIAVGTIEADPRARFRLEVWDVRSARRLWSATTGVIGQVEFGRDAVAVSGYGGFRAWDARTGRPFGSPYAASAENRPSERIAFLGDGRRLLVVDDLGRIDVRDPLTGRRLSDTIRGPADTEVGALAVSPVEDVAAVAFGRDVYLFDVAAGRRLAGPIPTPAGDVMALAFSSDGSRFYSTTQDGVPVEHLVAPGLVAAAVCARAGRTLTAAEWQRYAGDIPYRRICP